jgi:hypothetical protein
MRVSWIAAPAERRRRLDRCLAGHWPLRDSKECCRERPALFPPEPLPAAWEVNGREQDKCRVTFSLLKSARAPKRRRIYPIGARSGDLDKLARSVLDALTGVVFKDDAHVTQLTASKDWGQPGAFIEIESVASEHVGSSVAVGTGGAS